MATVPALAGEPDFRILGVITSSGDTTGVALIKNKNSRKTFAAKQGTEIEKGVELVSIERRVVKLKIGSRLYSLRVGDETSSSKYVSLPTAGAVSSKGLERVGDTVKVAADFRDHIVKEKLQEVIMHAAAVPHYTNGRLSGFQLLDIEPGSLYEKAGFRNGDLIKQINGQGLTDLGNTVKLLMSLKNETSVAIDYERDGAPQSIKVVVQ